MNDELNLNCKGCGREMLDTPDNRKRDLCIWCTTFGDGEKVRAYDAYVKKHGVPPVQVAPARAPATAPNFVRETVAPARNRPVPPATKKWYEKRTVKTAHDVEVRRAIPREPPKMLEIEGGDEKENANLVKEALEDLEKMEKKKVKK